MIDGVVEGWINTDALDEPPGYVPEQGSVATADIE
jgi:hypothetical protein